MEVSKVQHFTALKVPGGWKVYRGEPDKAQTYLSFKTHSDAVFDYCELLADGGESQLHFDTRG